MVFLFCFLLASTDSTRPCSLSVTQSMKTKQIPGMPETISVLTKANSTLTTATPPLIDLRFGGVTFGPGPGAQTTNDAVHTILPTGRAFDLPLPDVPDAAAAAAATPPLPEYSLETDLAPDDHAASVAAEIAHKIAEGKKTAEGGGSSSVSRAIDGGDQAPSTFRTAALKSVTDHVEIRERRAAKIGTGTGTGKAKGPAGIDTMRVPNLWLAVAHSSSLKAGEVKKVEVDGVPIALWRTAMGDISAQSDVCIHRGASLARGWIANNRLVCPCKFLFFLGLLVLEQYRLRQCHVLNTFVCSPAPPPLHRVPLPSPQPSDLTSMNTSLFLRDDLPAPPQKNNKTTASSSRATAAWPTCPAPGPPSPARRRRRRRNYRRSPTRRLAAGARPRPTRSRRSAGGSTSSRTRLGPAPWSSTATRS